MNKIKKIFVFIMAVVLCCGVMIGFCACDSDKNDKISIVCTIFPEYDWVREVVGDNGDNFEITLLMNNGTDLHNYQPTVADITKIATADIFIYVGGESDKWVDNALANAINKDMIVINLIEVLGDRAKDEELKEGMEGEEEEEDDEEGEDHEYDEHVWLSLKNAKVFVSELAKTIAKIDESNKSVYQENANNYIEALDDLDNEYAQAVNSGATKTLLFGDRFPFRYLVDDYDLDYYAAFIGCSAETEASFETITFLVGKVNDLGLKAIMKIETSNGAIANQIKESTNSKDQQILTLDSLQSTTLNSQKTYLSIMQSNLEVLKEAVK